MSRQYEIVYIFDSALDEAQANDRLERFHALLANPETAEPVVSVSHWGKRTLAYPIKRNEVGYYVVVRFETQPDLLGEFERALKLDEALLRHLIVLNEEPVALAPTDSPSDGATTSAGAEGGK